MTDTEQRLLMMLVGGMVVPLAGFWARAVHGQLLRINESLTRIAEFQGSVSSKIADAEGRVARLESWVDSRKGV